MAKLTDAQLIVLSKAAARDDGAAIVPPKMNKAAAAKVGSSLVARKLMRQIKSKPDMPVWREDDKSRALSLIITRAGRDAIGVDEAHDVNWPAAKEDDHDPTPADRRETSAALRAGSKQALIVEMLSKEEGVTIDALIEATGWLPHTTRAALTGLRKRGYAVKRITRDQKGSLYRIVNRPCQTRG